MLRITYSGHTPIDYIDGGPGKVTFYVTYPITAPEIEKLARYDCNQLNDCTFGEIIEKDVLRAGETPMFLETIYTGIEEHWDNYFKCFLSEHKAICYDKETVDISKLES